MPEDVESTTATDTTAAQETDTAATETGSTSADEAAATHEDHFISDQELLNQIRQDPKLSHFEKKMQAAYTKRNQAFARGREAVDLVERFNTDPAVRRQILQQYAHELGLPDNQGQPAQATGTAGETPPVEFVKAFKDALPPELQWMAESQAKATWVANKLAMAPYEQQLKSREIESREAEWDGLAAALPPGWELHEEEMSHLLDFLTSPKMRHPVYGNKLELLYRLATGEAAAATTAIERMGAAAQNRTRAGTTGRHVTDNLTERIMKTRPGDNGLREAIQIAGRAAIEKLEAQGARFTSD